MPRHAATHIKLVWFWADRAARHFLQLSTSPDLTFIVPIAWRINIPVAVFSSGRSHRQCFHLATQSDGSHWHWEPRSRVCNVPVSLNTQLQRYWSVYPIISTTGGCPVEYPEFVHWSRDGRTIFEDQPIHNVSDYVKYCPMPGRR